MNVAFRVDASLAIGSGHIMRCLTLANALRVLGGTSHFISRAHPGHLGSRIEAAGHKLTLLPLATDMAYSTDKAAGEPIHARWLGNTWEEDAAQTVASLKRHTVDWLIQDHYALDARWEAAVRFCAKRMMVIDDLADRPHASDLLLDQNLGRLAADYDQFLEGEALRLIGPSYALLRPEFGRHRKAGLDRRGEGRLNQILVSMGGVDTANATGQVLQALADSGLGNGRRVLVIMGSQAPWLDAVRVYADQMPFQCEVRVDVTDMALLMAESDLAIGAGGSTSWERCCMGIPSVIVVLAENQRECALALSNAGAALVIPSVAAIATDLAPMMQLLLDNERLPRMSEAAGKVADGQGVDRVLAAMREL